MRSFLTGSRVYGTPRQDSDIDLVVLVSEGDLIALSKLADELKDLESPGGAYYEDGTSLRFGKLNLLCVTEEKHFDVWRKGTEELMLIAPVTREHACGFLDGLRKRAKISGWG
jgi:predicted nucleotidyltransferase